MNKKILLFFCLILTGIPAVFSKDRPIIKDITANQGKGSNISLSWNLPENEDPEIRKLLLYRSNKPISSYYDISESDPYRELDPKTTGFTDKLSNYNDYYYAVIAVTDNGIYDIVIPTMNSTVNGIHLKLEQKKSKAGAAKESEKEKPYAQDSLREMPLPFLDLLDNQNKQKLKMSDKAKFYAKELGKSANARKNPHLDPYIFEEDLISPDAGDAYLLFEILKDTFIQKKYEEAEQALIKLLNSKRDEKTTERATFYLGETYYFQENYRKSTETFLKVYEVFPGLSKQWIEASLDLLVIPEY